MVPKMSFILRNARFDGRILPLSSNEHDAQTENHVTVIVGKNSTGKSRLLSAIVSAFESLFRDGHTRKIRSSLSKRHSKQMDAFDINYNFNGYDASLSVKKGQCF